MLVAKLSQDISKCETLTFKCKFKKKNITEELAVWASLFAFPK
jgi:hypothetical protein